MWSSSDSSELYGVSTWGSPYFLVNEQGNVSVCPQGERGPRVDLLSLTEDLRERGIRPPILIRFPDIVKARVDLLHGCFKKTIFEYGYSGRYRGVYPIKVNQQRHLVEELLAAGQDHALGLECGSKPELLVALAMVKNPQSLIICNGFKDLEYVETALLSQKLGKQTLIVIDRFDELSLIINLSKKLGVQPNLGFRAKLAAKGAGKWIESSGNRSKFGLTPSEMVEGYELLQKMGMEKCLCMLHFHIGSQITEIQSIKESLKEAARFYTELYNMGANMRILDVGGGLGVDYDGTGDSDSSMNYSEQEYANDVVSIIQDTCDEKKVPHPDIVTEAGRALVAHQSLLVFNVLGNNRVTRHNLNEKNSPDDHTVIQNLFHTYNNMKSDNINEALNDLRSLEKDTQQLFSYGVLSLKQLAKAENIIGAATTKLSKIAQETEDSEYIVEELSELLSDTYFGNFSVFQSLPDSWAVKQVFPIMPIHRLDEKPTQQATLVDLTCDSDGKIEHFIDTESDDTKKTLSVHELRVDEPYYLGVFLVGAYQEILGDLHNLFGDTDAVHIRLHGNQEDSGYSVEHVVQGDSVHEILGYLEYYKTELVESVRQMSEIGIREGSLSRQEARLLMRHYEDGLNGYTYLEDPE